MGDSNVVRGDEEGGGGGEDEREGVGDTDVVKGDEGGRGEGEREGVGGTLVVGVRGLNTADEEEAVLSEGDPSEGGGKDCESSGRDCEGVVVVTGRQLVLKVGGVATDERSASKEEREELGAGQESPVT